MQAQEADAERAKVDYERDCYRRAELVARTRLRQLQASFAETINAILDPQPTATPGKH